MNRLLNLDVNHISKPIYWTSWLFFALYSKPRLTKVKIHLGYIALRSFKRVAAWFHQNKLLIELEGERERSWLGISSLWIFYNNILYLFFPLQGRERERDLDLALLFNEILSTTFQLFFASKYARTLQPHPPTLGVISCLT